jgi:hypothetical protein
MSFPSSATKTFSPFINSSLFLFPIVSSDISHNQRFNDQCSQPQHNHFLQVLPKRILQILPAHL